MSWQFREILGTLAPTGTPALTKTLTLTGTPVLAIRAANMAILTAILKEFKIAYY